MARLTEADYRKALDVLLASGDASGPDPFPDPVLARLRRLVPCDAVSYHENSFRPDHVIAWVGAPVGEMTPEIRAAHKRLRHEDPVRPGEPVQRLTDVVSLREYRRRNLYREVDLPLGIGYMMWFHLAPWCSDARFEFDRADSDFSGRDLRVLDLILPHLRQFYAAARRRPRPRPAHVLTTREREVLAHVAVGLTNEEVARVLGISRETVRKHLENLYAKLGVHTRTAAVAALHEHEGAAA